MRVLYVGNSFTARNDVPGIVATLAAERDVSIEHALIWAGGAPLRGHWNKGEVQRLLESSTWDRVVLQEQSTLPIKNAARFHENVRLFVDAIRANGAELVLYATWARAHALDTQRALTKAYEAIGAELGATVARVGDAWERVLATPGHPELYDKDGSHPSFAGSYLAACVLCETIAGVSVAGVEVDVPGLSAADRMLLQHVASQTA